MADKIKLTKEQIKHFNSCAFVETCEFCNWVVDKLNNNYDIQEV